MMIDFYRHGQLSDLFVSIGLHLAVLVLVVVTFPNTHYPIKPHLIFLGSFLSQQDMAFSADTESAYQRNVNAQRINMDIRQGIYSHSVGKPEQKNNLLPSVKRQYKPVVAVDSPTQKQDAQRGDGLDESFGPVAPVRMKMILNGKD